MRTMRIIGGEYVYIVVNVYFGSKINPHKRTQNTNARLLYAFASEDSPRHIACT